MGRVRSQDRNSGKARASSLSYPSSRTATAAQHPINHRCECIYLGKHLDDSPVIRIAHTHSWAMALALAAATLQRLLDLMRTANALDSDLCAQLQHVFINTWVPWTGHPSLRSSSLCPVDQLRCDKIVHRHLAQRHYCIVGWHIGILSLRIRGILGQGEPHLTLWGAGQICPKYTVTICVDNLSHVICG